MEYSDSNESEEEDNSSDDEIASVSTANQNEEADVINEGQNRDMLKRNRRKMALKKLEVHLMKQPESPTMEMAAELIPLEDNMPSIFSKRGGSFDASRSPYTSHVEDSNFKDIGSCNLIVKPIHEYLQSGDKLSMGRHSEASLSTHNQNQLQLLHHEKSGKKSFDFSNNAS